MTAMDEQLLEQYVLRGTTAEQDRWVEAHYVADADVRERIDGLRSMLEGIAVRAAVTPPAHLRDRVLSALAAAVMAERESGRPPLMHERSTPADFAAWTDSPGNIRPVDAEAFHVIVLDEAPDRQTGLVWLDEVHPEEVHTDLVERIMLLEGTCDVHISTRVISLMPGDVVTIPMYLPHWVKVTSANGCKAIVQRVAA